jgi:hypothetical protein
VVAVRRGNLTVTADAQGIADVADIGTGVLVGAGQGDGRSFGRFRGMLGERPPSPHGGQTAADKQQGEEK